MDSAEAIRINIEFTQKLLILFILFLGSIYWLFKNKFFNIKKENGEKIQSLPKEFLNKLFSIFSQIYLITLLPIFIPMLSSSVSIGLFITIIFTIFSVFLIIFILLYIAKLSDSLINWLEGLF